MFKKVRERERERERERGESQEDIASNLLPSKTLSQPKNEDDFATPA